MGNITKQEVFDRVATHLLTQGVRSMGDNGSCAYRGSNGRSCAVGCLIKDEHYRPGLECHCVTRQVIRVALAASLGCTKDHLAESGIIAMLSALQGIHDSINPASWHRKLETIANIYNLEWKHG